MTVLALLTAGSVAPLLAASPALQDLSGRYTGASLSVDDELELEPGGRFRLGATCARGGGDIVSRASASGSATVLAARLVLTLDRPDATCGLPARIELAIVEAGGRTWLLSERNLLGIVNAINDSGVGGDHYLARRAPGAAGGQPVALDAKAPLPEPYGSWILPRPLVVAVSTVGGAVTEVPQPAPGRPSGMSLPIGPPRAAETPKPDARRLTADLGIDIGTDQGVFVGMRLMTASGSPADVVEATGRRSRVRTTWNSDGPPAPRAGMLLFSSAHVPLPSPGGYSVPLSLCLQRGGKVVGAATAPRCLPE